MLVSRAYIGILSWNQPFINLRAGIFTTVDFYCEPRVPPMILPPGLRRLPGLEPFQRLRPPHSGLPCLIGLSHLAEGPVAVRDSRLLHHPLRLLAPPPPPTDYRVSIFVDVSRLLSPDSKEGARPAADSHEAATGGISPDPWAQFALARPTCSTTLMPCSHLRV